MRCLPVYNSQNSYFNNNIALSINNSTPAYKSKINLFRQSNIDRITFGSKSNPEIEIRTISNLTKKKIFKYIMQVNKPDGPLVKSLSEYFYNKNPQVPQKYFQKSISRMYKEQARVISKISKSDQNTIVIGAFNKNKLAGIVSLIPIGRVNEDIIIYEICNLAVLEKYQHKGIGKKLLEHLFESTKNRKAFVLVESINPYVKNICAKNGFTEESKNSKTLLEAIGGYYSKIWLQLKEFNIDTLNIENIQVNNQIFDTCNKAWPELPKYY